MDGVEVPGMAERVESRRRELRLSPGDFAVAAGLTRQALADVRGGKRKQYQDVTIYGVARALRWEADWYERLLAGKAPKAVKEDVGPVLEARLGALEARLGATERLLDDLLGRLEGR